MTDNFSTVDYTKDIDAGDDIKVLTILGYVHNIQDTIEYGNLNLTKNA